MKFSHFQQPPRGQANTSIYRSNRIRLLTIAILLSLVAANGCHAAAVQSQAKNEKAHTLSQLVAGVVGRSANLTYMTEQDSEVFVFYRNQQVEELTDTVLLSLLRRPTQSTVRKQSWQTFFRLRSNADPSQRWAALQRYLEVNLTNLAVFQLPRDSPYDSQYDLYAVGIFGGNTVVGVQMFGVAT